MRLGRHHATVRRLRALRRDGALRREEGVFVAEGMHLAQEALRANASVELVVVSDSLREHPEVHELLQALSEAAVPCHDVAPAVMDSLQDARSPQPILLVTRRRPLSIADCLDGARSAPLVVVAHGIQDPGNLGAIVRSADAAGATGLVAVGGADLHHPRSVRATMGSIFRLPAVAAGWPELREQLRERKLTTLAASPAGGRSLYEQDLRLPTALVLGGEGGGLPPELEESLDGKVHVPMRDGVESLSVGAAAAVLLFEAARQRRADGSALGATPRSGPSG